MLLKVLPVQTTENFFLLFGCFVELLILCGQADESFVLFPENEEMEKI